MKGESWQIFWERWKKQALEMKRMGGKGKLGRKKKNQKVHRLLWNK